MSPYQRQFSFAGFQANRPKDSLPGQRIDVELDAVAAVIAGIGNVTMKGRVTNYTALPTSTAVRGDIWVMDSAGQDATGRSYRAGDGYAFAGPGAPVPWTYVGRVQGDQGVPGEKGDPGQKGDSGAPGGKGDPGQKGDQGAPTAVNGKTGSSIIISAADLATAIPDNPNRLVSDKLTALIDVSDYGVYPGSSASTNRSGLLRARDAAAAAGGGILAFPSASGYTVDPGIELGTAANASIMLAGRAGQMARLAFNPYADGFTFTMNDAKQVFGLKRLSIQTYTNNDTATGVTVNYQVTGFSGRAGRRVFFDDVEFKGVEEIYSAWGRSVWLRNVNGFRARSLWLRGRMPNSTASNAEADNSYTPTGIQIDGTVYPTDYIFEMLTAYGIQTVLQVAGAAEGIVSHGHTIVNCGTFVSWTPDSGYGGRPHLDLSHGHANVYKSFAKIAQVAQITIEDNAFYHNPGATSYGTLLDLTDIVNGTIKANKGYKYSPTNVGATALSLAGAAMRDLLVDYNVFGGPAVGDGRFNQGLAISPGCTGYSIGNHNRIYADTPINDGNSLPTQGVYGARRLRYAVNSAQSFGPTAAIVTFGNTYENTLGFTLDTGTGRFTVGANGVRKIRVSGALLWAGNATGNRVIDIFKNGSLAPFGGRTSVASDGTTNAMGQSFRSGVIDVAPGDIIDVRASTSIAGGLGIEASPNSYLTIEEA